MAFTDYTKATCSEPYLSPFIDSRQLEILTANRHQIIITQRFPFKKYIRKDSMWPKRANRVERARQWRKRSNWGSAAGGPILTALSLASCFIPTASTKRQTNTFTRRELSLSTPNLHFDDDSRPIESKPTFDAVRFRGCDLAFFPCAIAHCRNVGLSVGAICIVEKKSELERMQLCIAECAQAKLRTVRKEIASNTSHI